MVRIRYRLGLLLALLVATLGAATPSAAQPPDVRCFPETGHCIAGRLAAFWAASGGLPTFGFPISPLVEQVIDGRAVRLQWFERARLELHPDQAAPYDVQLGRVGSEALTDRGRDWREFPRSTPDPACRTFAETGHAICEPILTAWRSQGLELDGRPGFSEAENLALFGLPLSDRQAEQLADGQLYQVQWFERARFELHNGANGTQVQLGLLGREQRAADGQVIPQLAFTACPFRVPAGARITCGTLIVPLDQAQPGAHSAALAFAVFHAARPAADPILYLAGGPGSPALASAATLWQAWQPFIAGRDFVVIDQRGVGASWPALRCPEVGAFYADARTRELSGTAYVEGEAAALLACRDRLAGEGVPMHPFTTAASAADLEHLRRTLGYAQWNVLGISYGTRLALALVRDAPESVRSLVLDSPYPLQESLYAAMPAHLERSLAQLFSDCAAHPRCAAAYPDLEGRFWRLVAALNDNPARVDLGGGPMALTGDRLLWIMFRQLYSTGSLARLPAAIIGVERGDIGPLRALVAGRGGGAEPAQALYYAIQCAEDIGTLEPGWRTAALADRARLAGFARSFLELSDAGEQLCARFGAASPDARWRMPPQSATPTLILSGAYDPITPPEWRYQAAVGLSHAYTFVLPGTGHAALSRGACPMALIRALLDNPSRAPDGSCVAQLGLPDFR